MLVCRPFSCILGVHNAGDKRTKRCCKRTKRCRKRVGMLSHEDSWGNLAHCFLPSYYPQYPLGDSWRDLTHHLFATNDIYALAGHHYAAA